MTRTRTRSLGAAAALVAMLLVGGAVAAETAKGRPEWVPYPTELYALEKLQGDGDALLRNEAAVREQRKAHEGHLKAFADDAARVHAIKLEPGEQVGWDGERRVFFVVSAPGPVEAGPPPGAPATPAPVTTK